MKMRRFWRETRGGVLALTAMGIIIVVAVMALAIDLGHIYLVKSELRRAADAGAVAGALGLFQIPPGSRTPVSAIPDCNRALAVAQGVAAANQADGSNLQLLTSDVYFGSWDQGSGTFTPTGCANPNQVNAVKVLMRKDLTANGPVPLFFAGLLPQGYSSIALTAQALAITGFAGYAPPGGGAFPLAIDADKVPPDHARETVRIDLNPTTQDSGAWHTFDDKSPGASDLRGLVNGSTPSPPLRVGDMIRVTEGVADSVLQEVAKEFNDRGGNWTVLAAVIPGDVHTGWAPVLGLVAFQITSVVATGNDKHLEGYTVPDYVAPGVAPGGANYGLWAGVPKIVQ